MKIHKNIGGNYFMSISYVTYTYNSPRCGECSTQRTMFFILKARDFKDVPQVGFPADLY